MDNEGVIGLVGAEPIRPRFPIRVTLFGVAAVVIPEADYQALDHRSARVAKGRRPTRFDKDSEVRTFLLDRIGIDEVNHIREAAITRFGPERVPSISAFHRFVTSERVAARKRKGRR